MAAYSGSDGGGFYGILENLSELGGKIQWIDAL
jgi:hypothetical protein